MNVNLRTPKRLRYISAGDYLTKGNIQYIYAVKQISKDYDFLILLHELIEWYLTERAGIKEEDILKWDLEHPDLDEPGADINAIYHKEHQFAEHIERQLAEFMGIDWDKYENEIIVSE